MLAISLKLPLYYSKASLFTILLDLKLELTTAQIHTFFVVLLEASNRQSFGFLSEFSRILIKNLKNDRILEFLRTNLEYDLALRLTFKRY